MNIEQFELILCDQYMMDAWQPPPLWKWSKEFKQASSQQWAVRKLEDYIRKRLRPKKSGTVREFIQYAAAFKAKMLRYASRSDTNEEMREIFQTAGAVTADILDLLNAMK